MLNKCMPVQAAPKFMAWVLELSILAMLTMTPRSSSKSRPCCLSVRTMVESPKDHSKGSSSESQHGESNQHAFGHEKL